VSDGRPELREVLTDSLHFWEWRRIFYNLVLATIVLTDLALLWPTSKEAFHAKGLAALFFQAVVANVAYCAAYLADLFVQFSEYRKPWRRWRIVLWLFGTAFAALGAHILTTEMYATPPDDLGIPLE